jgi:hypothetical protein
MAMDSSHDCFLEFLPAIVTHPQREVSPHAISLVKEAIKQLLPLGSSLAVAAANLNVQPDLLHEVENNNHERGNIGAQHTFLAGKLAGPTS